MKKKIIIIISIIVIIALIGIGYIFRDDLLKFKINIYPIHSVMKEKENEEELQNEEIEESIVSDEKEEEIIAIEEPKAEKKTSKDETVKTEIHEEIAECENTSNSNSTPKNNTPPKTNNDSGTGNSSGNVKQEEKPVVVQKQPWEELGLTEDQYKNQPMYSWEEVDFKTKEECMNYGNEHAEYGFECSEVTSWTRSLGWDYKTF